MPRPVHTWHPATRLAWRFVFTYFALYSLATQISGGLLLLPHFSFPGIGTLWPMREITFWWARVFRATSPLVRTGTSGDTAFYWVQTGWLLIVATLATAVWSSLDARRENYATADKWFRLFIRFGLAAQMFYYGMAKVIPTQFPPPSLVTLIEPVGNLSLTDLLWTSVGASPAYEMFTGWAEVLAGLLLIVPRTTTLGVLICLADMIQVFVLNMTYDFGLKQFSFHLVLMAAFLLAPELPRLASVLLVDHGGQSRLFGTRRANRLALAAQILFGVYLLAMFTSISRGRWYAEGGGAPVSPLRGIWNVTDISIDGQPRSPVLSDYDRTWRRVIFDSRDTVSFQRLDDSIAHYGVSIDMGTRAVALTKGNSPTWNARFTFEQPAADRLVLDGAMDGYRIHMQLELMGLDTFRLLNSGFRWVRLPDPYGG